MQPDPTAALRESLEALANVLDSVAFALPVPDRAARELERRELVRSIREYLLPRLRDPDAPVVAALLGPTGSGKSTLLNSLAQASIGAPGVVRPATSAPVVWAHRDHARRYWSEFVARVRDRAGPSVEVVVGEDPLTKDLTLIDTPPFDYVSEENRVLAQEVLSVTDLCVFVTSPLRYADGDAWDFIRHAQRRGLPILFVVNRLPVSEEERAALLDDYASRLAEAGLLLEADPALLFAVPDQETDIHTGALPPGSVATLRKELAEFADPDLRHELVTQATEGAVIELADHARRIAALVEEELAHALRLLSAVESAYTEEARMLVSGLAATLPPREAGWTAVSTQLVATTTRRVGLAAQAAAGSWAEDEVGTELLEAGRQSLWRHGPGTSAEVEAVLAEWSADLEDLAAERALRKLRRRRRRRVVAALRMAAVFDDEPGDVLFKYMGEGAAAVVATARSKLLRALQDVFTADARRFASSLGDIASVQAVSDTIAAETAFIAEAAEALHA